MKLVDKSRTKKSIYNATSAIVLTLVNGALGIVVTRLVIGRFGSDFNGLNLTANQIINVLLILEGGFTLASNVALFASVSEDNNVISNGILRATNDKFQKIGILFLIVGFILSILYSFLAKTNLSREFVFTVIMMAVLPQAANLFFVTKYRVLLQAQQNEFVISSFTAFTIGMGHAVNILLILHGGKMWMVRFVTMTFALFNCVLISQYTKRKNVFIDLSQDARPDLIKGTNDVMAQKITSVVYTAWPIVFLSISRNEGTLMASVYGVYNSVFIIIKEFLHAAIDAPRLSFGQLLTEQSKDEIWPVYKQYEFVAIFLTFVAMTTTAALIMPFIKAYTLGVNDVDYNDVNIAILMILICTVEMLHIPSGHLINMSGNFKVSKYFQIIACVVLMGLMFVLGMFMGIYGMLISLLIVAGLLAILEIGFIHTRFFPHKIFEFIKLVFPYIVIGTVISFVEMRLSYKSDDFIHLLIAAMVFAVINGLIGAILAVVFNREMSFDVLERITTLLKQVTKKKNS